MPPRPKKTTPLPPLKVRQEPPTLDEAIIAARCLADDEDQIAEIAGTARRCSPDDVDELRHDYHRIDDRDWSWVVRRALVVLERQGRPVLVVPGEE